MHAAKRAAKIKGRGPDGKEIVFGMVERGGKVITGHVDTRKKKDLQPLIRERVEAGSAIFSDELKSYDGLESDYQHAVIDHAVEYANGNVHTNTMENFWSLLKRGLHGMEPTSAWNRSTFSGIWMSRRFATTIGETWATMTVSNWHFHRSPGSA
jgi:transposase-like protein